MALGGRERCQNDPIEEEHNPLRARSSKFVSFLRKSRFYDVFETGSFPLVFLSTGNVVKQ